MASVGGPLLRALVIGLLTAVETVASLVADAVRGIMIVIVVGCAAVAAGALAFANSVKKIAAMFTTVLSRTVTLSTSFPQVDSLLTCQ